MPPVHAADIAVRTDGLDQDDGPLRGARRGGHRSQCPRHQRRCRLRAVPVNDVPFVVPAADERPMEGHGWNLRWPRSDERRRRQGGIVATKGQVQDRDVAEAHQCLGVGSHRVEVKTVGDSVRSLREILDES